MQTLSPKPLFARCVWHINVLLIGVTDNLPRFVVWDRNRLVTGMLRHRTKLVALMANITLGLTSHPSFVFYPSSPGKKSFCTVDTTVTSRCHQQLTLWWHVESENEEIRCIHHLLSFRMTQLWRAVVVLSVGVASASPRDFVPFFGQREQRSLVNTFPFNDVDSQLPERETRQGLDNSVSSIPFSAVASSYAGGKR